MLLIFGLSIVHLQALVRTPASGHDCNAGPMVTSSESFFSRVPVAAPEAVSTPATNRRTVEPSHEQATCAVVPTVRLPPLTCTIPLLVLILQVGTDPTRSRLNAWVTGSD